MIRNDDTSDKKKFLDITSHNMKIPDDQYIWYFNQKILIKDIFAYYQKSWYDYYILYKWIEKKSA